MGRVKVIQDPVHGSISVDGVFLDVLDRHEMQRLRAVKQLGLGYLVFPGANHTRFEHSLGAYHLAGRMADAIGLDGYDSDTVRMAGLLHDITHPPFSHTLEPLMAESMGMDHMELARALITGKVPNHLELDSFLDGVDPIGDILSRNGISAEEVCDLIEYPETRTESLEDFAGKHEYFPSKDYEHQIIHGPVDADQMDYLMRDAHYTGIAHGTIDCDRLINTMNVHNDRIVIRRGGIVAAEGLMVSRSLMYTSVYFHETTRIAQRMLCKAVVDSGIPLDSLYLWSDADLVNNVVSAGGRAAATVRELMNRRLNKKALAVYSPDMTDEIAQALLPYADDFSRLEREIAAIAGVDEYDIAAEVTSKSNLVSSVKIGKTDVAIADDKGMVKSLTRFSSIAKSLQSRNPYGWAVLISAPADKREAVEKASKRLLGLSL